MESVPAGYEDAVMELLNTLGAVIAGVALVIVGLYSLAALWFDDLS
ncbi:MAG TPA: hypothetical protein VK969_04535 [Acidimicrobiia bacterium]|nr:hypothetical protein [Acidimicrobiia bacterium]